MKIRETLRTVVGSKTEETAVQKYDYFQICHSFVSQIKLFDELRTLGKIKKPNIT
ncbi:MAG: hypothetical protein ACI8ZN_001107 [Bacteroidia bacterium]|jgi:hypothetical protein